MKLYIYDHCPFCVRARMAAGLFGADVEEVVLANDDEATPIGMIGAKQVPVLQKEDGSFMGESLDIVCHFDRERPSERRSPPRDTGVAGQGRRIQQQIGSATLDQNRAARICNAGSGEIFHRQKREKHRQLFRQFE